MCSASDATRAVALARSPSRTPLLQPLCGPLPLVRALRASRGIDAWTNGHWTRRRAQAFAVAEAAGQPRRGPEAYSGATTGCANALVRPGIHRKRRLHRAAAFVSEHHEQLCPKVRARVLEAAPDLGRHNVTRYTNDEQVAEFRIEISSGGTRESLQPRMTANGCWPLTRSASISIGACVKRRSPRKKRALPSIKRESASSAPTRQLSSLEPIIVAQSILIFQRHSSLVGAETGFVVAI